MPFPLAKLVSLGLKQGSKYVASYMKVKAKEHETMRKIIIKSAQWYNKIAVRSELKILGFGKTKKVQEMTEEAALELGTEMVGDIVIILSGLAIYMLVDARSKSKESSMDRVLVELNTLKETVKEQNDRLYDQAIKIDKIETLLKHNMYSETARKVIKEITDETNKKLANMVVKR